MATKKETGVYQMDNGMWGYRFSLLIDGRRVSRKKTTDEFGGKLKTKKQAVRAREKAIQAAYEDNKRKQPISRRTVKECRRLGFHQKERSRTCGCAD